VEAFLLRLVDRVPRSGLGIALLLSVVWAALLGAGQWLAGRSSETAAIESAREEAVARFARIPDEQYRRDLANRLRGQAVDSRGRPIASAEVEVIDQAALEQASALAPPGEWPQASPEKRARCDGEGRFEMRELTYGAKTVVFRAPGHAATALCEISFADGYGASDVDGSLPPSQEQTWLVLEPDGRPAADEEVRMLPRGAGASARATRTDGEGRLLVPPETWSAAGAPRLLVGRPPVFLEGAREGPQSRPLVLPAARDLPVTVTNALPDPVILELLPAGARRCGFVAIELRHEGGRGTIERIRRGRWDVTARQGRRLGSARLDPEDDRLEIELADSTSCEARVADPEGAPIDANVVWESQPLEPRDPFRADPLAWVEANDPARKVVHAGPSGSAILEGLPDREGWLLIEAPGFAPARARAPRGASRIEVKMRPAVELSLRTTFPHLPVRVDADGCPSQLGRSDRACEALAWVPPGPVIAWSGIGRGKRSYPKGCWAGRTEEPLRFSPGDDRGLPGGCAFGFVTDAGGEPVPRAEVFLQGGDGQPWRQETDTNGFYRFAGLRSGAYVAFARREGDIDAYRRLAGVRLEGHEGDEGEARLDLALGPGVLELRLAPGVAARVEILAPSEAGDWRQLWSADPAADGTLRVSHLPPGRYRARGIEKGSTVSSLLGEFDISATDSRPVRLPAEARR
jgi:carboxypeptidase family protein